GGAENRAHWRVDGRPVRCCGKLLILAPFCGTRAQYADGRRSTSCTSVLIIERLTRIQRRESRAGAARVRHEPAWSNSRIKCEALFRPELRKTRAFIAKMRFPPSGTFVRGHFRMVP